MISGNRTPWRELALLALLALLWGSSYAFIKLALEDIPPVSLIAYRVLLATVILACLIKLRRESLPRDGETWRALLVQSFLNSIGAWTVLAWGQQYVDSGLAGVLNSTSPLFVFLISVIFLGSKGLGWRKLLGAILGFAGVVMIIGVDVLAGLGQQVAGQGAALLGAVMYACAAIYGRRFAALSAPVIATGTLLWASLILVPVALVVDQPWTLSVSLRALGAATILSVFCTGLALLIYFRLIRTLGSLGVASQAYLRAGVGVMLGVVFLGEQISPAVGFGLVAAIVGVALINYPAKSGPQS